MFAFKVATILAIATAAFAHPAFQKRSEGSCSTGTLQCCDSISPAQSSNDSKLAGLIPIDLQGLGVPLGINCIPFNVLSGGTSGTCSSQAACCSGVSNSGESPTGIDCSPINFGL